ncbi:MAG TPA: hypothetical protein VN729_04955 [Ktedonobacteraceae bacterium]|nr:hypothetical protein [Ktedonobacteraceae bacterium]
MRHYGVDTASAPVNLASDVFPVWAGIMLYLANVSHASEWTPDDISRGKDIAGSAR